MTRRLPPPPPASGVLPLHFTPRMARDLARSLPRPMGDEPPGAGRELLHDALTMVREHAPRDAVEAGYVQGIVVAHFRASLAAQMAAARQQQPELMLRFDRQAIMQVRAAAGLERQLRQRRHVLGVRSRAPGEDEVWDYDLDELERIWLGVVRRRWLRRLGRWDMCRCGSGTGGSGRMR